MRAFLLLSCSLFGCTTMNPGTSDAPDQAPMPPPARPALYLGWFSPGGATGVTVTGISEGAEVHLVRSAEIGSGPCPLILDGLCLDLERPLRRFLPTESEPGGWAYIPVRVPASVAVGRTFALQAAILDDEGAELTPAYDATILEGGVCFGLYEPVCGLDGVTYSNSCVAEMAGMVIDYEGSC